MHTSDDARTRSRRGWALAAAGLILVWGAGAMADPGPDPHTFSLDKGSPSVLNLGVDPADLLSPGGPPPPTQVLAASLGLMLGDELDAVSGGADAVQDSNILFFSVDRLSAGAVPGVMPPWDVLNQALLGQQAGDLFVTTDAAGVWKTPVPGGLNYLRDNQHSLGLTPQALPNVQAQPPIDRMDAVAFEEFDLTQDGIHDLNVYFSLDPLSPSLGALSAADILLAPPGMPFGPFAGAGTMGLLPDDDLDALVLLDLGAVGQLDPGVDWALFSLAPNSPTLAAMGFSPADIFMTRFQNASVVRYPAADLGLLFDDNVDALEVQIPEPACLVLLVTGAAALARRRKR